MNSKENYNRLSVSYHDQNQSTNEVKNQEEVKEDEYSNSLARDSGLCDVSCGRYSKKCFTQIYKAMNGDPMFVSI